MKKSCFILFILAVAVLATGCASLRDRYKSNALTPDGLNYTYAAGKNLKPEGHWLGVSWSLK